MTTTSSASQGIGPYILVARGQYDGLRALSPGARPRQGRRRLRYHLYLFRRVQSDEAGGLARQRPPRSRFSGDGLGCTSAACKETRSLEDLVYLPTRRWRRPHRLQKPAQPALLELRGTGPLLPGIRDFALLAEGDFSRAGQNSPLKAIRRPLPRGCSCREPRRPPQRRLQKLTPKAALWPQRYRPCGVLWRDDATRPPRRDTEAVPFLQWSLFGDAVSSRRHTLGGCLVGGHGRQPPEPRPLPQGSQRRYVVNGRQAAVLDDTPTTRLMTVNAGSGEPGCHEIRGGHAKAMAATVKLPVPYIIR